MSRQVEIRTKFEYQPGWHPALGVAPGRILTTAEELMATKYGEKAKATVKEAMHKYKKGELKSGKTGSTVKNPKQAVAIGLSEARKKGAKVPSASKGRKK